MAKTTKKAATSTAPVTVNHSDFYKGKYLTNWLADQCGPAPALNLFSVVHAIDPRKRPGHEALHIAMALRPQGCTVRQFQVAGSCGPANNYRRDLVKVDKVLTVAVLPSAEGRAYAFKARLTAKGVAMVKAAMGKVPAGLEADTPAKAPRKPRTPKVTAAPASEAAPVEPAPAPQA